MTTQEIMKSAKPISSQFNDAWPELPEEALTGLPGEIVKTIDPYTEADPIGVLAHILAGFGNLIGPVPHFRVEFDHHSLRINPVLVGQTSKGRKGQSWSTPRYMLSEVDPTWKDCITSGLSSGEGLIYAVRDPGQDDPGASDKRLFVVEQEFAQALKVMRREGNILSVTIRDAWDHGDLHPLTKTNRIAATGAHISIVGHITHQELLRHLNETEQANGFANRFIWLLVRRSKVIPEPTRVPEEVLTPLIGRLHEAVTFARVVGEIQRDDAAREIWAEVYPDLSEGEPGLLGAILGRAESQVMRLACIYALLDRSSEVTPRHLKAALALWDYSEASARRIFGDRTGNPVADRIVTGLRAKGEMTETEIRDLLNRHRSAEIDQALDLLIQFGIAFPEIRPTGGRPLTIWRLATKATKATKGYSVGGEG